MLFGLESLDSLTPLAPPTPLRPIMVSVDSSESYSPPPLDSGSSDDPLKDQDLDWGLDEGKVQRLWQCVNNPNASFQGAYYERRNL